MVSFCERVRDQRDIKFNRHYDEITKRGGMVGAYHFLLSGQDISSQAAAIERILQGKKLPLGVWADVEITSWSKLSRNQLESYLIRTREHFGESLGIYTSQYMWDSSIGAPMIGAYNGGVANYQVERPNLLERGRGGLWLTIH